MGKPRPEWHNKKPWFFFFKDGVPIATRVAEFAEEAIESFLIIRRPNTWEQCQENGISIRREEDIPLSEWEKIWAAFGEERDKADFSREVERQARQFADARELLKKHGTFRTKVWKHENSCLETSRFFSPESLH